MPTNTDLAEKIVADLGMMSPYEFEETVHRYSEDARRYILTPHHTVDVRQCDGKPMTGYEAAYAIIAFLIGLRHLYYGPAARVDDLESILL